MGQGGGKDKKVKVGLGRARELYKELGSISTVREEMENKGVWGFVKRENNFLVNTF